jgi:hypothetical protein
VRAKQSWAHIQREKRLWQTRAGDDNVPRRVVQGFHDGWRQMRYIVVGKKKKRKRKRSGNGLENSAGMARTLGAKLEALLPYSSSIKVR